ncbi:MAG: alpha-L-rhamnosidase, partial [Candidatus Latescibacteria bacterium]|nr:alpha-L-rhamnosidase [Candidatus Latescibacterota bacterium]
LNARWSQRGNFISIPTDCPQRDERLGWMGDAQIFIRTATYNMDVAAFFTKWMTDVEDAQSERGAFADTSPRLKDNPNFEAAPGWGDAGIIVPWTIWWVYGDTRIVERHWDAMIKWMDFLHDTNPDLLRRRNLNNNYGDWLSIRADTPKDLLATAYWAYDASLMADMARAIGRNDEALKYERLFTDVRGAFQREFVDADGRVYPVHGARGNTGMDASGTERSGDGGETQTNYVLALYFDLVPKPLREKAVEHLVDNIRKRGRHLSTGFIGVRHLNPVLTDAGRTDLAYQLLTQETYPSWLYPVKNGATTIWERWDGWTEEKGFQNPGMNSFNHYALGSICEWLYESVAGILPDPGTPAYKKIMIHPRPDASLDFARASYESIHGRIESGWARKGDTLLLDVVIPVNTSAAVYIPADGNTEVMEGGAPAAASVGVTFLRRENGFAVYEVGSGRYRFESRVTF